jgi:hypothetical protein
MSFEDCFNGLATQGRNVADGKNGSSNENNLVADVLGWNHQSVDEPANE